MLLFRSMLDLLFIYTCLKALFANAESGASVYDDEMENNANKSDATDSYIMRKNCKEFVALLRSDHMSKLNDLAALLQVTSDEIIAIISRCPQVLKQSMELEITPFVEYLGECLQTERSELGRVVMAYPTILKSCVQQNAGSVINFLREFNLNQVQLKKILINRPQLLALRVDINLRPTVDFLLQLFNYP